MKKVAFVWLFILISLFCFGQVQDYKVFASCIAHFDTLSGQWSEFSEPELDEGEIQLDLNQDQVIVSCCDIAITYQIAGDFQTVCNDDECAAGFFAYSSAGQECVVVLSMTPLDFIAVTIAVDNTAVMMFMKRTNIEDKAKEVKYREIEI
jgi:hypothetical protein